MTSERWKQITEVFHAVLAEHTSARVGYLDRACAGDRTLREEVDAMLAAHDDRGDFGEAPVHGSREAELRFANGEMIGACRVATLIGAGGMGEVYKAHDTRLGRDVAIKVLPAAFTADPERLARFEREARVLAALNHPQIAAIYGLEEAGDTRALILELVDGDTLSELLQRGPIPVKQALTIAAQIAAALETAHERGIIHRDLKPANIKATQAGAVKVLDFGLAKAYTGANDGSDLSQPPGLTTAAHRGAPLGTPAFMSPEQARGDTVDKRADIWAFGCVLFEMLTGRRAFPGETLSDTIASVLAREPDWSALPPETPSIIRRLLRRCLAKERSERLPDIGVARMDIAEALERPEPSITAPPVLIPISRRLLRSAMFVVSVLAVAAATGVTVWMLSRPAQQRVVRFMMTPPFGPTTFITTGSNGPPLAISPDGTRRRSSTSNRSTG
ncbi:MAG: serine/threonine-protein kinase [Vicinamibacterales bacterium]